MKKIMFSERFGLEQAVLAGKKTQTRRIIPIDLYNQTDWKAVSEGDFEAVEDGEGYYHDIRNCGKYHIGEEVAVAQSYEDAILDVGEEEWNKRHKWYCIENLRKREGLHNKMFVQSDLMPHRIRITNIKVERLQDISEEDAMREGVFKYDKPPLHHECDMFAPWPPYIKPYKWDANNLIYRCTARYAFAYLIDKISGGGTWQSNPWVYVYTFELIK